MDENPNNLNESFVQYHVESTSVPSVSNISVTFSPSSSFQPNNDFEFSYTNPTEVYASCMSMKSNAVGLDNIYPKILKILLPDVVLYLTSKSNKWLPAHFQLTVFSKVFEGTIYNQVYQYQQEHNLLTDRQCGFRAKHSCITALVDVTEDIRSNIDDGVS